MVRNLEINDMGSEIELVLKRKKETRHYYYQLDCGEPAKVKEWLMKELSKINTGSEFINFMKEECVYYERY